MKKVISLICAAIMLFTLCSCKPSSQTSSNASDTFSLFQDSSSDITTSKDASLEENFSKDNVSKNNTSKKNSSKNSSLNTSVASSNAKDCEHSYTEPTCENPAVCKFCGAVGKAALGHNFIGSICYRYGCDAINPDWKEWHSDKAVTISKSEVQQILSMDFKKPKNVIYMIGDGMGENDIILAENNNYSSFDFGLVLNQIPYTGYATTHCNDAKVTDSAAAGTALATGFKTNTSYVGLSPEGKKLTNISEIARQKGKMVGIVTNDSIIGATPSAFTVHNISRTNHNALAKSFVQFKPDVLIGQGKSYFDSFDLSGFVVGSSFSSFRSALNTDPHCKKPFLGFFNEDIISSRSNTLAYCTEIALNRMKSNPKGFFLMIESAGTDKAGHNKNLDGKLNSVVTFDRAIATVLKFMKENPDTLLIITSDHETGGVKLPQNGAPVDNSLFTTSSHTATNVRTFAVGYGAEYFNGKTVDNTDIAKFAIAAVEG